MNPIYIGLAILLPLMSLSLWFAHRDSRNRRESGDASGSYPVGDSAGGEGGDGSDSWDCEDWGDSDGGDSDGGDCGGGDGGGGGD